MRWGEKWKATKWGNTRDTRLRKRKIKSRWTWHSPVVGVRQYCGMIVTCKQPRTCKHLRMPDYKTIVITFSIRNLVVHMESNFRGSDISSNTTQGIYPLSIFIAYIHIYSIYIDLSRLRKDITETANGFPFKIKKCHSRSILMHGNYWSIKQRGSLRALSASLKGIFNTGQNVRQLAMRKRFFIVHFCRCRFIAREHQASGS